MSRLITRRGFLAAAATAAVAPGVAFADGGPSPDRGIRVRFLGAGAAGWKASWAKHPHMRRQSSVLLDGRALIDFTMCSFDMLPKGCRPEVLFQTHSHGDHYNPVAAVKSGVKRMYVHETWASAARAEVSAAAANLGLPAPEVRALRFGSFVEECGMRFMSVPANHSTSRLTDGVLERTSLYLVEKGPARLLYATDTGGICGDAARMIGIDPHIRNGKTGGDSEFIAPFVHTAKPITALVMEATNGDTDDDFRIFVHSSVQTVARIAGMLKRHGRFTPPPGQHAYITHLALKYRDWPAEKVNADIPSNLRAAYDGLEVVLG